LLKFHGFFLCRNDQDLIFGWSGQPKSSLFFVPSSDRGPRLSFLHFLNSRWRRGWKGSTFDRWVRPGPAFSDVFHSFSFPPAHFSGRVGAPSNRCLGPLVPAVSSQVWSVLERNPLFNLSG
jgi:hypothetical protein